MSLTKALNNISREINNLPECKITDPFQLKTWDDVCNFHGVREEDILPCLDPKTKLDRTLNAIVKINYISLALNSTWVPDFENSSQLKYYVYFQKVSGSWRVIGAFCDVAIVGSGFYFENKEKALHAGKTFLDIFVDYLP